MALSLHSGQGDTGGKAGHWVLQDQSGLQPGSRTRICLAFSVI